jgi:acyl carrier protein
MDIGKFKKYIYNKKKKKGTPLTSSITLKKVKQNFQKTISFLKSKQHVVDAAIVTIDLPSQHNAIVAFVVFDDDVDEKNNHVTNDDDDDNIENNSILTITKTKKTLLTTTEDLKRLCDENLDHYIVPSFVFKIDKIPILNISNTDSNLNENNNVVNESNVSNEKKIIHDNDKKTSSEFFENSNSNSNNINFQKNGFSSISQHNNDDENNYDENKEKKVKKENNNNNKEKPNVRNVFILETEIDEKKLKTIALDFYFQHNVVLPSNKIERDIEVLWRQQFQVNEKISIKNNFFDLGGDSLKAGQLISKIRKKFKIQMTVTDLFLAPTIELLARKISTFKTIGSPSIKNNVSFLIKQNKHKNILKHKNDDNVYDDNNNENKKLLNKSNDDNSYYNNKKNNKNNNYGSLSIDINKNEKNLKIDNFNSKNNSNKTENSASDTTSNNNDDDDEKNKKNYFSTEFVPLLSSTSFGCLFIQALPITLIYPIRRIIIWFLIAGPWVFLMKHGFCLF